MSRPRLELKVGLFVCVCLVLLAILLIGFSKGLTFFRSTFDIDLRSPNVSGLTVKAAVRMSGVQVGTVSDIHLASEGTNVSITLRISSEYQIHKDARFVIETSGFLGDQYVAIMPTKNADGLFHNGDLAFAEAPFNIQEFTRSATSFIMRVDATISSLDQMLAEARQLLLNPQTLTNLAVTASNLRDFSERAVVAVDTLNDLVGTNGSSLSFAGSNLVSFSREMNVFAGGLNGLLATNSPTIHEVVKNLESSSESLKSLLSGVQAGQGLAGAVLKDEELSASMSNIAHNLSIASSNLNRLGLWGILWKHKPPPRPPVYEPLPSRKQTP
jgi:phospholipid/cholesterol/gamma-HCH transport system substrate-binding protein